MKRFIDLGTQLYCPIDENDPECWAFAWYDTIISKFETMGPNRSMDWQSWDEFEEDLRREFQAFPLKEYRNILSRYKALYPKDKP